MTEPAPVPPPRPSDGPTVPPWPTPATEALGDGTWRRVHPLTPLVRSWQVVAVAGFFLAQDYGQSLLGGRGSGLPANPLPAGGADVRVWLAGGGLVVLALLALLGLALVSWRMTRYRVTKDAVEITRGVLFRQHRTAQLDRLQAVDVVQPLLARIFGLARLTIEVAGSGSSRLELSYLTDDQARELRGLLLAGSAGVAYDTPQAPEAVEHSWLEVPVGRLVGSIALSFSSLALALMGIALVATVAATGRFAALAALAPALLGFGGVVWGRFTQGFGFRAAAAPDGLRVHYGLLEQRTQTVPPGRVQAVRLSQPLLWRLSDWWRVEVNVAGYGLTQNGSGSVVLPVGPRADALGVLSFILPDLGTEPHETPGALLAAGLVGAGASSGFVVSPPAARWLDALSWQRGGVRVTRSALLIRSGVLVRELVVVPHARVQSLGVVQGPLQRRLGLATVTAHSTPGPIVPRTAHLAEPVAQWLLHVEAEQARAARAAAGPEKWMRPVCRGGDPATPPSQPPHE